MSKLKNKVAVVTGASKGLGAAIARYFASEGAKVIVNYASSKEGADKVVKLITDNGGIAIASGRLAILRNQSSLGCHNDLFIERIESKKDPCQFYFAGRYGNRRRYECGRYG